MKFWRRVDTWVHAEVSEKHTASIFNGEREVSMLLRKVGISLRICLHGIKTHTATYHRRENPKSHTITK
jgi:hypothetical protein